MQFLLQLLSLLLLALPLQVAATTTFQGKLLLPSTSDPRVADGIPSTTITLNGGEYATVSSSSTGEFTFYDLPDGIYVLDVNSVELVFPQVKIKTEVCFLLSLFFLTIKRPPTIVQSVKACLFETYRNKAALSDRRPLIYSSRKKEVMKHRHARL